MYNKDIYSSSRKYKIQPLLFYRPLPIYPGEKGNTHKQYVIHAASLNANEITRNNFIESYIWNNCIIPSNNWESSFVGSASYTYFHIQLALYIHVVSILRFKLYNVMPRVLLYSIIIITVIVNAATNNNNHNNNHLQDMYTTLESFISSITCRWRWCQVA